MRVLLTGSMLILLCACSSGESESKGHVWKEQTDMIDKAHDVEDLLGEANTRQRQRIEEQTQ